ncbi:hypothetical protein V6N11_020251 [Hibiscus sabdariffa]|uniref:Uncharacterized protein n=1 Tax=Hibiscus sabdariffa TaxID=183260 RepID=A0ABR2Q894_9ROSI
MTGAQHAMNSATGHQGGRLPDLIEVVEMPYMEDRPSLSVSPELQSVSKKGCGVGITAHEAIDLDMEVMDDDGDEELAPYKSLAEENTVAEEGLITVMKSLPAPSEEPRNESRGRRGSVSHMNRASRRLEPVLHVKEVVGMGESSKNNVGVEDSMREVAAPGNVVRLNQRSQVISIRWFK